MKFITFVYNNNNNTSSVVLHKRNKYPPMKVLIHHMFKHFMVCTNPTVSMFLYNKLQIHKWHAKTGSTNNRYYYENSKEERKKNHK